MWYSAEGVVRIEIKTKEMTKIRKKYDLLLSSWVKEEKRKSPSPRTSTLSGLFISRTFSKHSDTATELQTSGCISYSWLNCTPSLHTYISRFAAKVSFPKSLQLTVRKNTSCVVTNLATEKNCWERTISVESITSALDNIPTARSRDCTSPWQHAWSPWQQEA